ncbi:cell wall-binding repeat-containing protein, partial [bacterium]|nr:cell wall-binding repeat-containing protein [bacterium]
AKGWPLYLAEPGGISSVNVAAMKAAGVARVYILGGPNAVNDATRASIVAAGITFAERWDGTDRFATGVRVANESLERGLTVARPAVATGLKFPDALAGGVMQGVDGSVLLLTRPEALPAQVSAFVTSNSTDIEEIRFLGGAAAVSDAVRAQVLGLISP